MSTYLVAFVVGELEATPPVMVGPTPLRVWCVPGKNHLARFALDDRRLLARLLRALLRPAVSGRQARPPRHSRLRGGRHGEPGRHHLPRDRAAGRRGGGLAHRARARRRRGRPRGRPHVVRRPRDHGLVERHLAQRGVRHLHGAAGGGCLEARVEALDDLRRLARRGDGRGRAASTRGPSSSRCGPRTTARRCSTSSPTRRARSVLRMLEQHLGPEVFRDGVRLYLERHRFGNAETTDLWKALGDAARQPIPEVMDGWIFQPGYPLVSVEPEGQGSGSASGASRTWAARAPTPSAGGSRSCCAPRSSAASSSKPTPARRRGAAGRRCPPRPTGSSSMRAGHGFYRVRYAPPLLKKLAGAAQEARPHRALQPGERRLRARPGRAMMPAADYLDLTARFTDETDRNVWTALIGSLALRQSRDRGRARGRTRGPRAPPARGGGGAPRLGGPARRGRARRGSCAAISCARSARSATTRRSQERARGALRALPRGRGGGGRQRAARPHRHRGRGGRRGRVRGVPRALQDARARRRRSSATSTPSPASASPSSRAARSRRPSTARCGARTRRS